MTFIDKLGGRINLLYEAIKISSSLKESKHKSFAFMT